MDINSIIDNIKYAIASSHEGKVEIADNSFLLDLLIDNSTKPDENEPFSACEPWKTYDNGKKIDDEKIWEHRFPITRFIFKTLIYGADLIVLLIYWSPKKVRFLLSGKNKELSLSPRFNFSLFVGVIIFYVVAIIYILIFFIKSVLLFNPDSSVNEHGAITIPQPCSVEHYIYLFNAAECWANTGIKVLKGDEVKIYASGSFYSKISQMSKCAEGNDTLPYSRVIVSSELSPADSITQKLIMYKERDAKFGSLLLQIKEDWQEPSYDSNAHGGRKIYQLEYDKKDGFKPKNVDSDGVLCFAVNDIYFTKGVLDYITTPLNESILKNLEFEKVKIAKDSVSIPVKLLKDSLGDEYKCIQRDMWFYDNVGEILLSIKVTRNTISDGESMPSCLVKNYRWMEDKVLNLSKWDIILYFLAVILSTFVWFAIDYCIGLTIIHLIRISKCSIIAFWNNKICSSTSGEKE